MNKRTSEKLEQITAYPLFGNIGRPATNAQRQATSWPEAIERCKSPEWEGCLLMTKNTLVRFAHQKDWHRGHEWNNIVIEMQPHIDLWLQTSFAPIATTQQLPKIVADTLSWCVGQICCETEYQDIVPPLFYLPLIDPWLAKGHFPCGWIGQEFPDGWDGQLPDGQLVIY